MIIGDSSRVPGAQQYRLHSFTGTWASVQKMNQSPLGEAEAIAAASIHVGKCLFSKDWCGVDVIENTPDSGNCVMLLFLAISQCHVNGPDKSQEMGSQWA